MIGLGRRVVAAALTLTSLGVAGVSAGASPQPAEPVSPEPAPAAEAPTAESVLLPEVAGGERAVAALGGNLDEAARRNGTTPGALRARLAGDGQYRLDRRGHALYLDSMLQMTPQQQAQVAAISPAAAAPFDYAQTFLLHSRPGANRVAYLDFNGQTVSGTAWNDTTTGTSFTASPYDTDGSPGTFSNAEMDVIQSVWQRVAEDYAPFGIDVTTEEPPADAITRSGSSDLVFGTRAVISNTSSIYSGCGCGGIAYVGTYDITSSHAYYQPAWVFTQGVGSSPKGIAEATSHEIGHNLGLSHDGTAALGYFSGHGNWAPIMGVGYYLPITQWSAGEYSGANNTENDFTVIAANGGSPATDDAGDSTAAAVALAASPATVAGLIGTRTDVDMFSLSTAAATLNLSLAAAPTSPNLDARLDLINSSGTVIATSDPLTGSTAAEAAAGMGASLSATVAAGTYYVRIDGTGYGSPASGGYSDFGSVGRYSLTITGHMPNSVTNQPPTAVANATPSSGSAPLTVAFSSAGSADPGGSIASYLWTFGDGTTSTSANPSHVYSTVGSFTASLRVTDNQGATATASRTITTTATASKAMHVKSITMRWVLSSGKYYAYADLLIVDANGNPVPSAKVFGTFTGTATKSTYGTTGTNGTKSLVSSSTTAAHANFTLTVTSITKSGWTYNAAANVVTSASISR